jgi:hypothetical protein
MGSTVNIYPDIPNTKIILNLLSQIIKYLPTDERSNTIVWIDFVKENEKIIKAVIHYEEHLWTPKIFVYV